MKREADVWKYINKKRGARKWNDNDLERKNGGDISWNYWKVKK